MVSIPMSSGAALAARAGPPPYPDVTKIPTPPLQQAAIGITFGFPALALVVFGMRTYIRVKTRIWGLGMSVEGAGRNSLLRSLAGLGSLRLFRTIFRLVVELGADGVGLLRNRRLAMPRSSSRCFSSQKGS